VQLLGRWPREYDMGNESDDHEGEEGGPEDADESIGEDEAHGARWPSGGNSPRRGNSMHAVPGGILATTSSGSLQSSTAATSHTRRNGAIRRTGTSELYRQRGMSESRTASGPLDRSAIARSTAGLGSVGHSLTTHGTAISPGSSSLLGHVYSGHVSVNDGERVPIPQWLYRGTPMPLSRSGLRHPDVGRFFHRLKASEGRYELSLALRAIYPDDATAAPVASPWEISVKRGVSSRSRQGSMISAASEMESEMDSRSGRREPSNASVGQYDPMDDIDLD